MKSVDCLVVGAGVVGLAAARALAIARPGGSETEFSVQFEKEYDVPGLVNLFGVESTGLTACPTIAEGITRLVSVKDRE